MGIKFSLIFLGFLSMVIYKVLYAWCLRYNNCSTWFLDIRISTCSKLLSTSHFEYLLSVSTSHQSILFKPKMFFLLYGSTRVTCRNTVERFWWMVFCLTDLLSLSILLCFFVCSTCEVIRKMKETIRMWILACFISLFYHLNKFQKNLKIVLWVSTPSKLNICLIKSV